MNNRDALARYYLVDDLPGSKIPASRLCDILEKLHGGHPLTIYGLNYLQTVGLTALGQLAKGEVSYQIFLTAAVSEQNERKLDVATRHEEEKVALRAKAAEQKAMYEAKQAVYEAKQAVYEAKQAVYEAKQAVYEAERRARESDPKYIAKMKNQELCKRYGLVDFSDAPDSPRVMTILHTLECGDRLPVDDVVWLKTGGKRYFSQELKRTFHKHEAVFYAEEYKRTGDPWNAVNSSSHYRKCEQADIADGLLNSIPAQRERSKKLKSALATTHGGVMRDLRDFDKALQFGTSAHAMTPNDFRPCTLLGAVNFDLENYAKGHEWFTKAAERGATERSIDSELRVILSRADKLSSEKIKAFLVAQDPVRYGWTLKA